MRLVRRRASALLLWAALFTSRGLFAQGILPPGDTVAAADQVKVALRPMELRYAQPQPILGPAPASIKALYVNAWAFGSPKLWQLVRLADETEINAFVIDVKDDTGCMLYPSAVPTAQEIGANACTRAKDARARLDTLVAHGIYPIARFVVAKDPLLAERKPGWSVQHRDGGLWRDRPVRHLRAPGAGHRRPRHRAGVGGLHRRSGRRAADGVSESLLPRRLRVRASQCRALPRGPHGAARGAGPLAPAR